MYSKEELYELVNQAISQIELSKEPKDLYDPISYTLSIGGKRIRPVLSLLCHQLYSDFIEHYALMPAIALEVFHGFTLIHDDIMDEAAIRRGQPTVHKKWGLSTAILSGDAMSIESYRLIAESNPKHLAEILKVFNKTAAQVCEGQQLDMNFESAPFITHDDYLEMIELKTGVLVAASAKIGGIAAGAPSSDCNQLYQFGLNLGLAFQIQDDILDTYGDSGIFGKAIGGDIATNKKTFLLVAALRSAEGETLKELNTLLKNKEVEKGERYDRMRTIYDTLNVRQLAIEKVESFFTKALANFNAVKVSEERKKEALEFAHQLLNRSC